VYLDPPDIKAYKPSVEAINDCDILIVGPGDLFSTVLPVIIVPQIKNALKRSKAKRVFIINIANKPFETAGFRASNYIEKIEKHLGENFFDTILINSNQKPKIPSNLKYTYVTYDRGKLKNYKTSIVTGDYIDTKYPLYHDSKKVALRLEQFFK